MKSWAFHHSWTVQNGRCHIGRVQIPAVKAELQMQMIKPKERLQASCGENSITVAAHRKIRRPPPIASVP